VVVLWARRRTGLLAARRQGSLQGHRQSQTGDPDPQRPPARSRWIDRLYRRSERLHGLQAHYEHQVVNHAIEYVNGNVHTNGLENFWSLLKRTLAGTYVSVEPFHLCRYVDEQAFRFNNRKPMDDGDRLTYAMRKIVGRRLTWDELIGKQECPTETQSEPWEDAPAWS
jgi:hypothetical protein